MSTGLKFPTELNYRIIRDSDRDFQLIWLITFVLCMSTIIPMSRLPVEMITKDELKKYVEVIHYRVKLTPKEVIPKMAMKKSQLEMITKGDPLKIDVIKQKNPSSAISKKQVRNRRRKERDMIRERQRHTVRNAANNSGVLRAANSRGARSSQSAKSIGLSDGGATSFNLNEIAGFSNEHSLTNSQKKSRSIVAVTDDNTDIEMKDVYAISSDDIEMMFEDADVILTVPPLKTTGNKTNSAHRNQEGISKIVQQNNKMIQYCYWSLKRQDSTLKGLVKVRFTINPAGEIIKILFYSTNWNGNPMGKKVERCIRNLINEWRFDPIPQKSGNVTASATYIFE